MIRSFTADCDGAGSFTKETTTVLDEKHPDFHKPVLLGKVLEFLVPGPGKLIVDGTLGGGGHASAFLEAGATVIGIDQDPEAVTYARERLAKWGERFEAVHANFSQLDRVLGRLGIERIDGGLLDVGVSSWQLDSPARGFSFMRSGPLDMRMNPENPVSAADLVNNASGEQLERIFRNFGEEPAARRITARILQERLASPIATTERLAEVVEKAAPRRGRIHPATRVFQALRIAVNRELEALSEGLEQFSARLAPGGRLAVISFHSLEDRIVKQFFKTRSTEWLDRPEWPQPRRNPDLMFRAVTRKPATATEREMAQNPRSRSARLRVVERMHYAA